MPRSNLPQMETPELQAELEVLTQAIEANPENAETWRERGDFYKRFDVDTFLNLAIYDYSQAIGKDSSYPYYYNLRGIIFQKQKKYSSAIQDHLKAIDVNHCYLGINDHIIHYVHLDLGRCYFDIGLFDKALAEYEKANALCYGIAFFWIGLAHYKNKNWQPAEKAFAQNIHNENCRYFLLQIKREKYDPAVFDAVAALQQALIFTGDELTHYTSLNTGEEILIKQSKFHLGHIGGVNDPNEGKLLWQKFGLDHTEDSNPVFIACFLPDPDNLNMWRFYGKNHGVDAAGCAITYQRTIFETATIAKDQRQPEENTNKDQNTKTKDHDAIIKENLHKFQQNPLKFYRVLYVKPNSSGDGFTIDNSKINELFDKLITTIEKFKNKSKENGETEEIYQQKLAELLAPLRYLIKHHDYHAERECRIIVSHLDYGDGEIRALAGNSKEGIPPRLYLELEWDDHLAPIKQVTLGPKSPFADQQRAYWRNELKKRFNKELSINRSNCSFQ